MEEYAGRILAERYRLPLPPSDEYELIETRAFDTRSGQEVLVHQVPLPEVVDAELLDGTPAPAGAAGELPAVRRAIAAAQAAASVPDHPRLDQVFDVFAEGESLWIVSELVPARPLAALIADEPLSPYRAAEVASDVLTALRVLHAHGWTHRNITVRTVLICEDGRVVLTGLAAGAAEEALCGYDPVPVPESEPDAGDAGSGSGWGGAPPPLPPPPAPEPPPAAPPAEEPVYAPLVAPGYDTGPRYSDHIVPEPARPPQDRAAAEASARAGTVAAYRAGTRAAAAKVARDRGERGPVVVPQLPPTGANLPQEYAYPYGGPDTAAPPPWHGATPRRPAEPEPDRQEPDGEGEYAQQPYRQAPPAPDSGRQGPDAEAADGEGAYTEHPYRQGPDGAGGYAQQPYRQAPPAPDPGRQGPDAEEPYRPEVERWSGGRGGESGAPSGLPARLALPQGYRQADAPAPPGAAPDRPQAFPGSSPAVPGPPPAVPDRHSAVPGRQSVTPDRQSAVPDRQSVTPDRQSAVPDRQSVTPDRQSAVPDRQSAVPGRQPLTPNRPLAGSAGGRGGAWGGGPRTGLDAERARQTRMAVVGPVTERWAPEQAGPVHGHWQLAAPVGPATDLWALGALLYRAVQGHAPYPEDSVAELVEMVCAEPPAFAEECGPLRPVVESLLRQDPTERPDFEELRGWLRSLVRSAPEPDGDPALLLPPPEPDPARLPVVRRRGELHGRHRNPAAPRGPRSLGRTLLVGVLALMAAAVAYALLFMPRSAGPGEQRAQQPTAAQSPARPSPSGSAPGPATPGGGSSGTPGGTPQSKPAQQPNAPEGYTLERDPEHFTVAVPQGWTRRSINEAGQVRYTQGAFTLVVVPGRDRVEGNPDPKAYQQDKEPELSPYRNSTWAESGDVKSTTVAGQLRVTGRYTWIDSTGRSVLARNFVVALGGSYHVVMVTGPKDEEDKVTDVFEKATASYQAGG
ncbi:protein kinase [Streptomyces sp. NPDC004667]|uniref:protein kinase n=1 Tax=Streptomyces sp. NPDC004667 TaxID=3154285 RepID=UPI0033A5B56B